jgi:mannose-6-phosphate isomerase-like protein (cupin superfamily)
MRTKKWFPFLITILLSFGVFNLVHAQAESLLIEITKPSEGETLYAGPETLIYCINIEGRVSGVEYPTAAQVVLEIIQNGVVIKSTRTFPDESGLFIIPATVNPEGSEGNFNAVEVEAGCESCHYRASLDLPSKGMLLKVIATTSDGQEATAERQITVDLSGYATVPIQVTLKNSQETVLSGITVQGATRLYEWRARNPLAETNENGIAHMRLEALAEAPTRYLFYVVPTVIDGVLYQGVETKELTLTSGATSAKQITLQAVGSLGSLTGRFHSSQIDLAEPIQVWAIHLPDGETLQIMSDEQGHFEFPEIPYGSYIISADARELSKRNLGFDHQMADLTHSETGSILIPLRQMKGITLTGTVVDQKNNLIPFAQITIEDLRQTQSTLPSDGTWSFFDLPTDAITLSVNAPGYFSQKRTVSSSFLEKGESLELELKRRSETKRLEWGMGEVIIPPETNARLEAKRIIINQGWLWGSAEGEESLSIVIPFGEITLTDGSFALEITPTNDSWFYLWDGTAKVWHTKDKKEIEVASNEMVVLSSAAEVVPIPINPVVEAALRSDVVMNISPVWELSLGEQIRVKLSSLGTNIIQTITLITYIIVFLIIIVVPLWVIITRRRHQ